MVKKKRLKKPVKFIIIAIVLVLGLLLIDSKGLFNPNILQGYMTLDLDFPEKDENIQEFFLNFTAEAKQIGQNRYSIFQKYQVGKDNYCAVDCVNKCEENNLSFTRAYSQRWGQCKCKCLAEEVSTNSE